MTKCFMCKKEITSLKVMSFEESHGEVDLFNGELNYSTTEGNVLSEKFLCPACGRILFDNSEQAEAFLNGNTDSKGQIKRD